ncbi:hypothetical protein L1887_16994 [Cichorium endivia]|nr:hypothetical protein L1887_16994 [Cichorium endivia]
MKILDRMKLVDIAPNEVTYNCLIKGYCDEGRIEDAMNLIQDMPSNNCSPDTASYHTIMGFYCKQNWIEEIRDLMKKMNEINLIPDQVTYNMLIHMLSKSGYGVSAIPFLKEAEENGFYSALIQSFCEYGDITR